MPDDTSIKSLFDHAKQPPRDAAYPGVYATWVEQEANMHPKGSTESDLVRYANGLLRLSADMKTLKGDLKLWRNVHKPGSPPDLFADAASTAAIRIGVTDAGVVTTQLLIDGKPMTTFNGAVIPPVKLAATYDSGLIVERNGPTLRSLSFTLGWYV